MMEQEDVFVDWGSWNAIEKVMGLEIFDALLIVKVYIGEVEDVFLMVVLCLFLCIWINFSPKY